MVLCEAIKDREIVTFFYDGSIRTVEPHLVGYGTTKSMTLSAWQLAGETGTGWRRFLVSNMSAPTKTGTHFQHARPHYNPNDATMARILCAL